MKDEEETKKKEELKMKKAAERFGFWAHAVFSAFQLPDSRLQISYSRVFPHALLGLAGFVTVMGDFQCEQTS